MARWHVRPPAGRRHMVAALAGGGGRSKCRAIEVPAVMLLLSLLLATAAPAASTAAPQPTPPRSCAAGSIVLGSSVFGDGSKPYSTFHCTNVTSCCAACAANPTRCGAYFAKVRPGPDGSDARVSGRGDNLDECHLYDMAAAAHLQKGKCPRKGGPKHVCGSAIWVTPAPSPPPTPGPPPAPPAPPPPAPPAPPAPRPDVVELMVRPPQLRSRLLRPRC